MTARRYATTLAGLAAAALAAQTAVSRIDYLKFAQGAVPVAIGGAGAKLGANFTHAVQWIDGDVNGFSFLMKGTAATDTEFIYALPAATVFDRFAVPNVLETPSPTQTFTKTVEIHGSSTGSAGGFILLASATLTTHRARGQVTELAMTAARPAVRWVKLRLVGGIDLPRESASFEFSDIIGNGRQEPPALVDHFRGVWRARADAMQLVQDGPVVSGCFDSSGVLTGTVTGNILRATGEDLHDKTKSAFILSVAPEGDLRGVRSTNGGPFRLYTMPAAPKSALRCTAPPAPALGCGSIIHGITFDYDSADLRPDSAAVLAKLYGGLRVDRSAAIVIEGHTSSEGDDAYNRGLSERRARSVVAELTRRGIDAKRLSAAGLGETRPIALNSDESGRAMNRRVEVKCK